MRVLELFSGSGAISAAFRTRGHQTLTVDWDEDTQADMHADVWKLRPETIIEAMGGEPDIIWASPDCTTYSVAALHTHRNRTEGGVLLPQTEYAWRSDLIGVRLIDTIRALHPRCFFVENPRGAMRKMPWLEEVPRYTVTYCQYGDTRQKPTDIWTDHPAPRFKPPCKRGDPCHVAAPRGSRTGTQGIKGALARAVIPAQLCDHIVDICEELQDGR